MSNDVSFSCVQYPKTWGVPRFQLGEIVRYRTDLAFVSGLNYVVPETHFVQEDDLMPGWYAEVTFLTGDWAQFYECVGQHESLFETIDDRELAPLLGREVSELPEFLRSFVQNISSRLAPVEAA